MVIFHSYVSLPEGIYLYNMKIAISGYPTKIVSPQKLTTFAYPILGHCYPNFLWIQVFFEGPLTSPMEVGIAFGRETTFVCDGISPILSLVDDIGLSEDYGQTKSDV